MKTCKYCESKILSTGVCSNISCTGANNTIKLYHVAIGYQKLKRQFVPKVPASANPPEDMVTPRICFADSIERCLSAIGYSFYYRGTPEAITVWECKLPESELYTPQYLYKNNLVQDALFTHEYWYSRSIELVGKHTYLINFETTPYRIPDESKKQQIIQYIQSSAETFNDSDLALLNKSNVHDILYKVLANWDRYKVDEEAVADYVGWKTVRCIATVGLRRLIQKMMIL